MTKKEGSKKLIKGIWLSFHKSPNNEEILIGVPYLTNLFKSFFIEKLTFSGKLMWEYSIIKQIILIMKGIELDITSKKAIISTLI